MDLESHFDKVYENYGKFAVVPVAFILLSIGIIGFNYATQGEVVSKGVVFVGGTEIRYSIQEEFTTSQIEQIFASKGRPGSQALKQTTGNSTQLFVTVPPPEIRNQTVAENILNNNSIKNYTVEARAFNFQTAAVAEQFFKQASAAFALAFTIMSLVIFISFRDLIPSLAVIFAAAGDIVFSVAAMSLLGIPLTLGSLSALLMLIGYSVDTDIVLSSRVLKENRGTLKSRIWSAVTTGVTMSSGGIAGFTILYFVSTALVGPSELSLVASVMVIGLLADIPFTWFGNAYILKLYEEGSLDSISEKIGEVIPWN